MIRHIHTEHVRAHTLSDRAVDLPNALDHDRQTRYGVQAKTGMWITYRDDGHMRSGRVLGRVEAPHVPDSRYPCDAIDGYLSVLALADNMQHAYIRWINPVDVAEVSTVPPTRLLAFITGPLPTADIVHRLSEYGTLSERYVEHVDHHVKAFECGVSPAAYDAGVRAICLTCGHGKPAKDAPCVDCQSHLARRALAGVWGAEWIRLSRDDQALVIRDCTEEGGVQDYPEYRRRIGVCNLQSYADSQRVRFAK